MNLLSLIFSIFCFLLLATSLYSQTDSLFISNLLGCFDDHKKDELVYIKLEKTDQMLSVTEIRGSHSEEFYHLIHKSVKCVSSEFDVPESIEIILSNSNLRGKLPSIESFRSKFSIPDYVNMVSMGYADRIR